MRATILTRDGSTINIAGTEAEISRILSAFTPTLQVHAPVCTRTHVSPTHPDWYRTLQEQEAQTMPAPTDDGGR